MDPIIETHLLGKKFNIAKMQRYQVLREAVAGSFRSLLSKKEQKQEHFWALQDISFAIGPGERVGIIGKNGAGKSTLLKILSGITPPTTGRATIRGRLASLLEVGTGFHPELTGRENIYFNGAVLGLKRAEIKRQFDAIVDFSGIGSFLDTPLKKYSSGMELRLAFAVAAHLEPEVLLIDEVLAVGDAEFQKKCLDKMGEISRSNGKTIIFVSHNLAAIKQLCDTAILLDKGKLLNIGASANIVNQYLQDSLTAIPPAYQFASVETSAKPVFFSSIFSCDKLGKAVSSFLFEDTIYIQIHVENKAQYKTFSVGIAISDLTERRIITDTYDVSAEPGQTRFMLQFSIPPAVLTPGTFVVDMAIEKKGSEMIELIRNAIRCDVTKAGTRYESLNYDYGVINTTVNWKVQKNDLFA